MAARCRSRAAARPLGNRAGLCDARAVRLPEPLRPGDLVAVVAPSSPAPRGELLAGLGWLAQRYRVRVRADVLSREGYLAGGDARRAAELASALADPEVRAIFCARGGYGVTRVLDGLPWADFARRPSWLVGFSDITALHLEAQRRGVVSLHAANVTGLGRATPWERARLMAVLERGAGEVWDDLTVVHAGRARGGARASGPAVGGNLTMLATQAAAGHDHEAAMPVLAQLARDREAVLAGQAEIEQHQGRRVAAHQLHQRAAVVQLGDAEALALQVVAQQARDVDLVVEHRKMGRMGHG